MTSPAHLPIVDAVCHPCRTYAWHNLWHSLFLLFCRIQDILLDRPWYPSPSLKLFLLPWFIFSRCLILFCLFLQGIQNHLRSDWTFLQLYAEAVEKGVTDGRSGRVGETFSCFLSTVWSLWLVRINLSDIRGRHLSSPV